MSEDAAKYNDQPASERSCPDPAGYAALEAWLKARPNSAGLVLGALPDGQISAGLVADGGALNVKGATIADALNKLFSHTNEDRHEAKQSPLTKENQ